MKQEKEQAGKDAQRPQTFMCMNQEGGCWLNGITVVIEKLLIHFDHRALFIV